MIETEALRPSARTPGEREAHYLDWCERMNRPDNPAQRELFMRRYIRPAPPDLGSAGIQWETNGHI